MAIHNNSSITTTTTAHVESMRIGTEAAPDTVLVDIGVYINQPDDESGNAARVAGSNTDVVGNNGSNKDGDKAKGNPMCANEGTTGTAAPVSNSGNEPTVDTDGFLTNVNVANSPATATKPANANNINDVEDLSLAAEGNPNAKHGGSCHVHGQADREGAGNFSMNSNVHVEDICSTAAAPLGNTVVTSARHSTNGYVPIRMSASNISSITAGQHTAPVNNENIPPAVSSFGATDQDATTLVNSDSDNDDSTNPTIATGIPAPAHYAPIAAHYTLSSDSASDSDSDSEPDPEYSCSNLPPTPSHRVMTLCGKCLNLATYDNSNGALRRRCPYCRAWYGAPSEEYIYGAGYAGPDSSKIRGVAGITEQALRDIGCDPAPLVDQRCRRQGLQRTDVVVTENGDIASAAMEGILPGFQHYGTMFPVSQSHNGDGLAVWTVTAVEDIGTAAAVEKKMRLREISHRDFSYSKNAFHNLDRDGRPLKSREERERELGEVWRPATMVVQESFRICAHCDTEYNEETDAYCPVCYALIDGCTQTIWRTKYQVAWAGWRAFDISTMQPTIIPSPAGLLQTARMFPGKIYLVHIVGGRSVGLCERPAVNVQ